MLLICRLHLVDAVDTGIVNRETSRLVRARIDGAPLLAGSSAPGAEV